MKNHGRVSKNMKTITIKFCTDCIALHLLRVRNVGKYARFHNL
jgi:hypothetical protein